jgi:hypothetical protein
MHTPETNSRMGALPYKLLPLMQRATQRYKRYNCDKCDKPDWNDTKFRQ